MNDKYELLEKDEETGLFRIRALRDIPEAGVKAGDLGGFVAGEGNLSQEDGAWVGDKAQIYGNAEISGNVKIFGFARVCKDAHFLCLGPIGSRDDYTTFYRTDGVGVSCGCFRGTLEEFASRAEETHRDNPVYLAEYRAAIAFFLAVMKARRRARLGREPECGRREDDETGPGLNEGGSGPDDAADGDNDRRS